MKSKLFTVTSTQLNSDEITEVNPTIFVSEYLQNGERIVENKTYYPTDISFANETGSVVSIVVLNDEREENLYEQHPEFFDFIPINANQSLSSTFTSKVSNILVKKESGSASSDFKIICIGYKIV